MLKPVQIVVCVSPLGLGAVHALLGIGHVRPRLLDGRFRSRNIRLRAVDIGPRNGNRAHQRANSSLFVGDLAFESGLVRNGLLQRIFIGAFVDIEKQIAFLDQLVVLHI